MFVAVSLGTTFIDSLHFFTKPLRTFPGPVSRQVPYSKADKELIQNLNKISNDVKIEVSEELEEGSAIVETPEGIVDASIATQLNNLKEMVLSKND